MKKLRVTLENPGVDPSTSHVQSERSTRWANSPMTIQCSLLIIIWVIICHSRLIKVEVNLSFSRVAQRKRAGPITQRSVDRNHPLLHTTLVLIRTRCRVTIKIDTDLISPSPVTTDSSVGRAEDCRWYLAVTGILRSLVQIRLGGLIFIHISVGIAESNLI